MASWVPGTPEYWERLKRELAVLKAKVSSVLNPRQPTTIVTGVDVEIIKHRPKAKKKDKSIIVAEVVPMQEEKLPPEEQQALLQFASLSQLVEIKKKLEKEEFEGKMDPRTLNATDTLQWLDLIEDPPHKPWITAYFINDGPNTAEIGINHPQLKRQQIKLNETLTITQEHADERIRKLFYKCATGQTATVRVAGHY